MAEDLSTPEKSKSTAGAQSSESGTGLGFLADLHEIILEDALNAIAAQSGEPVEDPLFDESGRRIPRYGFESTIAAVIRSAEATPDRPNTLLPFGEDESLLTDAERENAEAGQRAVLNGMTLAEYLDDQGEEAWDHFARDAERTVG